MKWRWSIPRLFTPELVTSGILQMQTLLALRNQMPGLNTAFFFSPEEGQELLACPRALSSRCKRFFPISRLCRPCLCRPITENLAVGLSAPLLHHRLKKAQNCTMDTFPQHKLKVWVVDQKILYDSCNGSHSNVGETWA